MSKQPYRYEEEYREQFLQSANITFTDGSVVTPEEVWDYLTQVAPKKYPYAFEANRHYRGRVSMDVTLPAALKNTYLRLTLSERMEKAKDNGATIVFVQGGQAIDPYTAAGAIALKPPEANAWSRGRFHGESVNDLEFKSKAEKEKAHRAISFEACGTAGYEQIQEDDLRFDLIAPYATLRCPDIPYGLEAHRHGRRKGDLKLFLVDYPLSKQGDKQWAIEYFAQNLRKLVESIDEISGKQTTDEDLRAAIKLHNEGRRLARELADLWWSADRPPTNGADRNALFSMGTLQWHGDVQASLSVLAEARDSIAERVKNDIKGYGIVDNPRRLFVCGSCVSPNTYRMEEAGAIIAGKDDFWQLIDPVAEEGDPYYNLAKTTLAYPYEQSLEARAAWTIEQVKKLRADGLLFLYNWGCNSQSAVARAICDIVKRETGLPTLVADNEMKGTQSEQQANRTNAFIEMVG